MDQRGRGGRLRPAAPALGSLVVVACSIVAVYWGSRTGMAFGRDVRSAIFRKVESFSKAEIDKFSSSSLITRSTNDIVQIQTTTMLVIRMAFYAPIMGAGAVILALRTSPSMSWLIAGAVVIDPSSAGPRQFHHWIGAQLLPMDSIV